MELKYKIAHKRTDNGSRRAKTPTQRDHLMKFLKGGSQQREEEVIPIEFDYADTHYEREGVPVPGTYEDNVCFQLDIKLNEESPDIIRAGRSGWKMSNVKDQFITVIGNAIPDYYGYTLQKFMHDA